MDSLLDVCMYFTCVKEKCAAMVRVKDENKTWVGRDMEYESTFLAIADMTTMKESGKMHCGGRGEPAANNGEGER